MPLDIKPNILLLDPHGVQKNADYKTLAQYMLVIGKGTAERQRERGRDQRPLMHAAEMP